MDGGRVPRAGAANTTLPAHDVTSARRHLGLRLTEPASARRLTRRPQERGDPWDRQPNQPLRGSLSTPARQVASRGRAGAAFGAEEDDEEVRQHPATENVGDCRHESSLAQSAPRAAQRGVKGGRRGGRLVPRRPSGPVLLSGSEPGFLRARRMGARHARANPGPHVLTSRCGLRARCSSWAGRPLELGAGGGQAPGVRGALRLAGAMILDQAEALEAAEQL